MKDISFCIEDLGINGEGIGRFEGKTCFVPFVLPGEEVEATVVKEKDNLLFCKANQIKEFSCDRIVPKCPYFKKCGGCNLQHLEYKKSLDFKTKLVKDTIKKIAKTDVEVYPTVASDKLFGYRTKNVFPIGDVLGNAVVGMFEKGSHNLIKTEQCMLANDATNKVLKCFEKFLTDTSVKGFNFKLNKGVLKYLVVQTLNVQTLVTVVATKNILLEGFVKLLEEELENFGVYLNINAKKDAPILDGEIKHICGIDILTDEVCGIKYEISPFSFMQVNSFIKEQLYNQALDEIGNDVVVDAYSGAGLFSCMLSKKAKQVVGIEIVKAAVKNADKTKKVNNIENLINVCGDCKKAFKKVYNDYNPNVVVLDPPQKGVEKELLDEILQYDLDKIIYISCNPKTLARDISVLKEKYNCKKVQPFDMFPNTTEVETLVVLEKIVK